MDFLNLRCFGAKIQARTAICYYPNYFSHFFLEEIMLMYVIPPGYRKGVEIVEIETFVVQKFAILQWSYFRPLRALSGLKISD